jgi:tripartite-type tricarboxylate transporter receptor subunit TctC
MINATRRCLLGVAAVLALGWTGLGPAPAQAQEYPSKPITMFVGYQPGGQTDLVGRAVAKVMSEQLGVPVNVVNKPGAGGAVAATELQKADPDGYTLLFHSNTVVNSAPFIMERVNFTPKDFEYAGMITAYQVGLVTQKDAPFDNLLEFVVWAKKNPGFGYGSLSPEARMYMEEIAKKDGLDVNIVPLKGGTDMISAILGKQVVLALSGGIHNKYPDQMKMVTALTTFRHPSDHDVLTIEENGYPLGMDSRTTLFLPKGTPRPILELLAKALKATETDEDFKKVVAAANIPIMYLGVDEAYKEMANTYAKNKGIMESVGITAK